MKKLGASEVIGVDPDCKSLQYAVKAGNLSENNSYAVKIQNLPTELDSSFDLITFFLWGDIPRSEWQSFVDRTKKLLKDNGKLIVTLHDEVYISDPYGAAVAPFMREHFDKVKTFPFPKLHNKFIVLCSKS